MGIRRFLRFQSTPVGQYFHWTPAMLVFTFSRQQIRSCIYCYVAFVPTHHRIGESIGQTVLACRHPLPRFYAVCFESDLNRLVLGFACTHVCIRGWGGGCSQSIVAADISQQTSKFSRQARVSLDEDFISHICHIVPHPTAKFYSFPLSVPLKFALI